MSANITDSLLPACYYGRLHLRDRPAHLHLDALTYKELSKGSQEDQIYFLLSMSASSSPFARWALPPAPVAGPSDV